MRSDPLHRLMRLVMVLGWSRWRGRVLLNAGLIVAVQWVVITHGGRGWVLLGVLVLLFASHAVTRALTITTEVPADAKNPGRRTVWSG